MVIARLGGDTKHFYSEEEESMIEVNILFVFIKNIMMQCARLRMQKNHLETLKKFNAVLGVQLTSRTNTRIC